MSDNSNRASIARLEDRGVVAITGADAVSFLNGLVTNDITRLSLDIDQVPHAAHVAHAALLSPQGKILFDFFAVRTGLGVVLDVARGQAPALIKRLAMYKLRAAVEINDVSDAYHVLALWGPNAVSSGPTVDTITFDDPRTPALGKRILAEARFARDVSSATNGQSVSADAYHAHRIALGVPEGGKDYPFGDAYPHEANFDLCNGVSFTKGCYVGQEVVARMHNKSIVRKRVVKITGASELASDADILFGDVSIGRIGSADRTTALAMLRLDRAEEAREKAVSLTANGVALQVDEQALARYRVAVAARPASLGSPI
jgi:tRNA-modifying protein YgfZ